MCLLRKENKSSITYGRWRKHGRSRTPWKIIFMLRHMLGDRYKSVRSRCVHKNAYRVLGMDTPLVSKTRKGQHLRQRGAASQFTLLQPHVAPLQICLPQLRLPWCPSLAGFFYCSAFQLGFMAREASVPRIRIHSRDNSKDCSGVSCQSLSFFTKACVTNTMVKEPNSEAQAKIPLQFSNPLWGNSYERQQL